MSSDNDDSAQSISEEEEDLGLPKSSKNFSFSMSNPQDNKERGLQVLSQLEILRQDASKLDAATSETNFEKRPMGSCVEDEIELPIFNNVNDSINYPFTETVLDSDEEIISHRQELVSICPSDDEIISEEEKLTFGSTEVDKRWNTWSEENKEVEALVCLNENPGSCPPVGSFSKLKKSSKGGQRKVTPNLLFRFRSRGIASPLVVAGANEISMPINDCSQANELRASANRVVQNSIMESRQVTNAREFEKQEQNLLSLEGPPYKDCNRHSVTELLESLQEKHGLKLGIPEMHHRFKGRKTKAVVNKITSALGGRTMDGLLDVASSSEDEDNLPNLKPILKQRTIADQFHEAFEAVPQKDLMSDRTHRESSSGLFESLQHVLTMEKEREVDYLKNDGIYGNSTDGRGLLDVRILSRSLEAKLIVCCCTLVGDEENLKWLSYIPMRNQIGERILTIMFCTRVCSNVELEVGNLIRLYPPWKEVNVEGRDEMIILSTYFSHI